MAARFVLEKTKDGQFLFNLKAANGRVVLTSERYRRKAGAESGIAAVRKNAARDDRYEMRSSRDGKPYFVLKAANQEVIGRSETYSSRSAMQNGMASVRRSGKRATVLDRAAK